MDSEIFLDNETAAIGFLSAAAEAGELSPRSLLLLLTTAEGRLLTGVAIDQVPPDPPPDERARRLGPLLRGLDAGDWAAGGLLAVGREGDPKPRGGDFAWHDVFAAAARNARMYCHGTYVVTPLGVRKVRPYLTPSAPAAA